MSIQALLERLGACITEPLEARIAELEAERDKLQATLRTYNDRIMRPRDRREKEGAGL